MTIKTVILLSAVVLLLSCGQKTVKEAETLTPTVQVEIVFHVEGMTCDHCEMSVQKSVSELKGVSLVEANHEDSTTLVSFDPEKTTEKEIISAIEKRGYTVTGHK